METTATRRIAERFSRLTSEQRRAVYEKIRAEGLTIGQFPILVRDASALDRCHLSYAQLRQWFLWQLDPQSTAYHISGALRLKGTLDAEAVQASFAALVARHESLRTVFRANADGLAEQVIREDSRFDMQRVDLGDVASEAREARADEAARQLNALPFDLSAGPLLRVGLIRLAVDDHLLVVVMHHIVSDGWSMQVVVDEFVTQYRSHACAEESDLQPLPIQYADYAVWQRNWLEAGEKDRQLSYWKEQLGTEHPVLQLPVDHARRADGDYRAAQQNFELPRELVKGLQKRVQGQGATLFMALLAGFQVLLGRHTGQRDIRVGVPIANRHRVETEGVIGFFVNTQVLRNVVDGRASLSQVLLQAREAALGAQAHQDLPFEQLVEASQPERSLSTSPLFQVMFNHQRADFRSLESLPGLTLAEHGLGVQAAQFELTLDTTEGTDGRVLASFSYARELFDTQTMVRMVGHYLAVLQALSERPDQAVGDVPLLGEAERSQLSTWGVNAQAYDDAQPVHRLFEHHAAQRPHAPALLFGEQALSYGELNARANRLAHHLIARGVKPEHRVGIAVERSVEMMVGILAILKAGGAYVPLDPEYPADRLAYMVEDSGIGLLLTQSHIAARLSFGRSLATLALDALDLHALPAHDPQVALHRESLAYLIYTSGSTGRPKGVGIAHHALVQHAQESVRFFGLTPADRMLQFSTLNFDGFVEQAFPPLVAGAAIVLRGPVLWDSDTFYRELIGKQISVADLTTAYWLLLAQDFARHGVRSYGALRQVHAGGEAMPPEGLNAWRKAGLAGITLLNTYGPTEATVTASILDCAPYLEAGRELPQRMPIGVPLAGRALRVVGADFSLVPQGAAGELCIGGALLARGYLGRPGLSAERFVADSFDAQGGRLYRTGDLVRWNSQGQLEYLGRIDHQVKIRGFRVELGEVEASLLAQPEVREAVVVANEGPSGARLVGYVSGQGIDAARLRQKLGEMLPNYMVPAVLVALDALPQNANGKVDRKALPAPEFINDKTYETPAGEAEQKLSAIWAEVLGVARVGRNDNFFELGGHSLLALRLLERVRGQGWSVQVRTLFQHPQLAAFAQALVQEQGRREVVVPPNLIPPGCEAIEPGMLTLIELDAGQIARIEAAVPGGASSIQDIYPLAPLQEGMLFHHLLQTEGDTYVTPLALSFDGKERLERFVDSLNRVIARHDILRTAVLWEGLKEPVQVVHRQARMQLQWLVMGDGPSTVAERLNAHVDPAHYRIDVRSAPMIHAVAAHDPAGQRWLLQLPSHHLVLDHATLDLLVEEIAMVQQGRSHELPAQVPFRRYVAQTRLGVSRAEHEAFFGQMLGDVDEPTAPFDLLDVQGDGTRVEEGRQLLEAPLAARIRQQAQRHGVTPATLFHLAWALVLAKTTGKDDVVFGTVLFGRMEGGEGGDRALGLFINTLPVRIRLGAQDMVQCLRQTHAALTGLLHHEHASLSLAQRCSALPGGTPLFSALLNYRYSPQVVQTEDAFAWDGMEVLGGEERTNYPLGMSVDDLGEGFELVAQVHEAIDVARVCGYMHAAIRGVVDALAEKPEQLASEIDVMSEWERLQLASWSENTRRHEGAQPVHRQIEQHARQTPDATALLFGDEALSYGELNARANRLAHHLIALGVKPEALVGIVVDRSVEMMVGILAILKAGGAYVPLDPEYPADRLAYMVEDSGIALLLTQRHLRPLLPAGDALRVLELDTLDVGTESAADPKVALHGEHLAYVIYTSGSTGKPKGAAIRHDALYSCMAWMQETYRLTEADTVLHKAPFGFDVSCWEMFWPLTTGVRLVIANPGDHRDPERLVQLIQRHQITTLNFVPSMLQAFLAHEGIEATTRLRYIICGGEAMPAATQREALQRLKGASLQNLYGPTETTIHVTQWTCRDDGLNQVPIGRPISDTQAYVLDAQLNEVPAGVAGELYLGGINLARGYLRRAGLTSERFVATNNGQRLYRTGDLVRWNAEGQIEYLGRIDHQVKVRGFRIELGEIEAQLLAQPEVREAVVVADEGPSGARLVGYVSAHAGQAIDVTVLRGRLGRALPDYMVPGVVMVLERLPLNANGKVDRKALPRAEFTSERAYEAPEGVVEQALAAIWAEVLGVARVGRNDNFFELGGHSLLALRLLEQVRSQGWKAQVRTLFQQPQLAAFAAALVQEQGRREVVVPPNLIPAGCASIEPAMLTLIDLDAAQLARIETAVEGGASNIQDIYPLAPLQEGMLFHHLMQAEGDAYITSHAMGFDSRERLERFIDSFNQVIERHDILRTAVLWEHLPDPVQVVQRKAKLQLQWVADAVGGAEAPGAAERLQAHVDPAHYRIDLQRAPLIRAAAAHDAVHGRWLLQLPSHHMVLDHTTLALLVEEITLIQQGRQHELPEPVPFRRYVAQARLGVSQAEHEAFFSEMLGDVDEPTAPFDLLDVQGNGTQVKEARLRLAPQLAGQVRSQAQRYGVSAATLFHLAWALVLGKATGKDDVVFGTVLFGRMQGGEGAERALGLFINTLPLRVRLGAQSVEACVRHAHAALTGLLHHEHANLSLAQRCSALPGGTPLFSALLNYRYSPEMAPVQDDGRASAWEGMESLGGEERTNYPFGMSVDDLGEGFELVAQIHEAVNAQRVCGFMRAAIDGIVDALAKQPARLVCELDLMAAQEKAQLASWGERKQDFESAQTVHGLIEHQAKAQPQATALVYEDRALSYGELNARANRLAHHLIALGVKPEAKVGIAVERSIAMVVGILAILKAGGAYVPLDPAYPAERLAYMVADSGVALVLTQSHLSVPGTQALQVLALDALDTGHESDADPQVALSGENLAYVIYTSGSTGRPKGAQLCHRNVTRLLDATEPWFHFGPEDVWTMFHSYAFDFSVWEMFGALCTGGKLVVVPFWVSRSPEDFLGLLRAQQVTVLNQTPSAFGQLIHTPGLADTEDLALRHVIFGGEALEPNSLRTWMERFGDDKPQLINMYGITETTVHVTYRRITVADLGQQRSPVGLAIPDLGLCVLDAQLNRVPIGVAGELHVSGEGLARGYLNRAGLTAERFVATDHGQRLYRTGDLVRWSGEGQLEYLGRIDHQVKVRGFRIELGEIEAQLLAQPELREAIVLAREGPGGTRLVGYVSVHGGQSIETGALRERLAQTLPDYMVPSALVVLQGLPLNANGKVDRKALPDAQVASEQVYEAPEGAVEEALAAIWAEVLGVARVGRGDNFFELGGHSLLALRLLERVRGQGWPVQVRTLFQHPQLGAFAQALLQAQAQGHREVVVPPNLIPEGCEAIQPAMLTLVELDAAQIARIEADVPGGAANIQDIYPLAPLQEGMLFHHLLQSAGDAYVTPQLLSFDSRERLEQFIDSFDQVIARHDILRTAVLWEGLAAAVQVVHRQAKLPLQWLQAGSDSEAGSNEAGSVEERLNAHVNPAHYRIDVRQAPMVRAIAAHDPVGQRWLLQLPNHHMVLDHTTLELLVEEIALIQQGRQHELPEPVPFRRYVAQARLGVSQAEHEAFFSEMLGDVDEPTAPFNLLDVQGDGTRIEEVRLPLEAELAVQIRGQAQRHGVSAATLFHLAWALVLGKATGKDDVVFGTVLFGRMQGGEGAERALGLFINTLPLRVRLGARGVQASLRETHAALTQLLHHEHASLALAQRCSGLPGGTPLFSAMLNYRYTPKADAGDGDGDGDGEEQERKTSAWEGMEVLGGEERTNYPVTLSVDDEGEGFALVAQIHEAVDAQRVCGFMHAALSGIVQALQDQPQRPVCELALMPAGETDELAAWGVNPRRYEDVQPVHRLIEQQARRTPDAPALSFGEQTLGYGELNARANRLAHHLIALGVKPEAKVGIAVERSLEMVVGILAILKAGGAYVPLDPEYPVERLAYMVADSGVSLLLTQSHLSVPGTEALQVLALDALDTGHASDADPQVALSGENLAYVIYTSGSTGKPKGAANRHRALYNRLAWMQQAYALGDDDTVLQKTPFSFDVSVWEFLWPLMFGARLAVALPGDHRDPARLRTLIAQHRVTTLHFVPSMLQAFLAQEGVEACTCLRRIVCSGEALSAEGQNEVFRRLPQASLYNLYGPTEAAIDVTHWHCRDDGQSQVPIGRPISDTQACVLDAQLNEVPAGVAGELYLGGVNLARGYLNRAGLTAERFIATAQGQRLYRTGDLVRWNVEGQLEYLGRIDHQVKVRGFRIELGEIEAQLLAQPEVREAVVVAREGGGGARLVGYVSAHAGLAIETVGLRERLAQTLPDYMVPSALVVLQGLPLNANGKVDRKALPDAQVASEQVYEAPEGAVEEALAAIWAEVLGVARVGRGDNFFELGGHSLLALRVITHPGVRDLPGLELNLQVLMTHPTIGGIVDASRQDHLKSSALTLLNKAVDTVPPLFCIHSGLGTVLGYLSIAQKFNGSRAVYGLACRTLANPAHRDESLDQMAGDYVAMIRAVQPSGPYHLLGWSLGGTLAARMTAKLEAQGQAVHFLGLVDSYVALDDAPYTLDDWRTDFVEFLASINVHLDPSIRIPEYVDDPLQTEAALQAWVDLRMKEGLLPDDSRYSNVSAAELVRLFVVSRSLSETTLRSNGQVAPLNAQANCWWVKDRPESLVQGLALQLGPDRVSHKRVDANHLEIVASEVLLADLSVLLDPSRDRGRV
ncbi:non-ribosomal peptide synthetase [Variovorax paradoxus]|uniref:Amino acid adenylation domain protein n=1 Tax=Variovorax paradoxus (strain EPS) TaxID=595537 RepID=E6V978_VARPE|nr:non-ribosomal peptide synthetase [Variovorax paradoxus]ADU38493.1 amino acid adenylation domain protein [Variovorax paradoxus EPS]